MAKSRKELLAICAKVFDTRTEDELFAVSDGQVFVDKNRAELHAGEKLKVYPVKRDEVEEPKNKDGKDDSNTDNKSASDLLIEEVNKNENVTELTTLLEAEKAKKRPVKKVVEAIEARLEVLAKSQEVNTGGDNNDKTQDDK